MSERLKKYFTDEELQFVQNLAKQKGMKETDVVFSLAREMIQTYQLRYVSGQQVLTMLDLLAMKLPQWFALQLNLVGQSSLQVTSLSKQLASLSEPSAVDKIIQLLRSPEISKVVGQIVPLVASLGKLAPSPTPREDNDENDTPEDDDRGGEWL